MILDLQAAGDGVAKFELAVKYRTGDGVQLNLVEAVIWYAQAALGGHAVALSTLRLAARDEVESAPFFSRV
jgi:TPR repeat protein